MAGEMATDVITTSEAQHSDWPLPTLQVLAVIPGNGKGRSMIFVRRQLESLRTLHVNSQPFFLNAGTSPRLLLKRWLDLRREIASLKPDLIHAHYGTVTALLCALATTSVPLVITFRGSDLNYRRDVGFLRSYGGHLISQLGSLRASAIVCVSRRLQNRLWWRKDVSVVLPTGVNLDVFQPIPKREAREKLGYQSDRRIVLFSQGNSPRNKGQDLALAGVRAAERTLGPIQLVILDGRIPPDQVPVLINAADCLVLASEVEGSPNIVKEALACNVPVVAVDVGDVPERLRGVFPSRIVQRDAVQIGSALAEILACGKRSNGRDRVTPCSETQIAKSIRDLYVRVLLNYGVRACVKGCSRSDLSALGV
jgi:glycosyltransferase involved in cell wall biosynthesis